MRTGLATPISATAERAQVVAQPACGLLGICQRQVTASFPKASRHWRKVKHAPKVANTLGDHLRLARIDRGLKQTEVAEMLGVVYQTVVKWENNMTPIPDRVFALESGDKGERILCFLEADRGTMPVERAKHDASSIARKLLAYAQTWKTGIHRSRFGISRVRVLTVTTSESRCQSIRSAASTVSAGHGIFLQTHITSGFSPETCLGCVWRNAANELGSLLD